MLSLILPVYNVEKYINECLKSIENQTCKDFELIIVDDGSTDNCSEICKTFSSKNRNFRYFRKENGGLSSARNFGIRKAYGTIIGFIDSDDYIDINYVKSINDVFNNFDVDCCVFGYMCINNFNILGTFNFDESKIVTSIECFKLNLSGKIKDFARNKIFKREIVEKANFPEDLNYEDIYTIPKYILYSRKVFFLNKILYFYRQRVDGISFMPTQKNIKDNFSALIAKYSFVKSKIPSLSVYNVNHLIGFSYGILYFLNWKDSKIRYKELKSIIDDKDKKYIKPKYKLLLINHFIFRTFRKIKKIYDIKILKEIYFKLKMIKSKSFCIENNSNIILDAPNYGNLGDLAILYAETKFLNEFTKRKTVPNYNTNAKLVCNEIKRKSNVFLFLTGGGNMGDNYDIFEYYRKEFLKYNRNKQIIIFPQTIFFEKNNNSEIKKYSKKYNKHGCIKLFLREKESFELAKKIGFKECFLVPDIVLSLLFLNNFSNFWMVERENYLCCLRNDKESKIFLNDFGKILNSLNERKEDVFYSDTVIDDFDESDFENLVMKKIKQFSKYKLIVTDRLHGMVFSILSGTPCIVLSNYNYKISGVYEWVKSLNFIKFCENIDDFNNIVNEVLVIKRDEIICQLMELTKVLKSQFKPLIDEVSRN